MFNLWQKCGGRNPDRSWSGSFGKDDPELRPTETMCLIGSKSPQLAVSQLRISSGTRVKCMLIPSNNSPEFWGVDCIYHMSKPTMLSLGMVKPPSASLDSFARKVLPTDLPVQVVHGPEKRSGCHFWAFPSTIHWAMCSRQVVTLKDLKRYKLCHVRSWVICLYQTDPFLAPVLVGLSRPIFQSIFSDAKSQKVSKRKKCRIPSLNVPKKKHNNNNRHASVPEPRVAGGSRSSNFWGVWLGGRGSSCKWFVYILKPFHVTI